MTTRSSESSTAARPATVGMIGLGLMGTAMTERLLEHGYRVVVWNRTRDKAEPLLARGAVWSDNPLAEANRVIISLYSSDVVADVLDQLAGGLAPDQLLLDTTTGEPEAGIALAGRLAERRVRYLDAPISGSSEQTRRGEATVMVGGAIEDYAACGDLWPILGRAVFHVGPNGAAARMKLVSNLVLGLNRAALAEGLAYARAIGVDPRAALDVLKGSMAYSRVMDVKGEKLLTGDYSVQARLSQHLKDVRLILESAAERGQPLPLSETHRGLLEEAEARGWGALDNCVIARVWERPAS